MRIVLSADHRGAWPEGVERSFPHVFLVWDNWNDYGYETLFRATLHVSDETEWALGGVKIAHVGHTSAANMRDVLGPVQDGLDQKFFSLGQRLDYYEQLAAMPKRLRTAYAGAMRDVPILRLSRDGLEAEPVFSTSLLRTSAAREALDRAPALFGADAHEVATFEFTTTLEGAAGPHSITFDFDPDRGLPHRINVLVGVNGVGKTQLMARLAVLLTSFEETSERERRTEQGGTLRDVGTLFPLPSFYGVIAVSFSAFDDFELPDVGESDEFRYAYCGLRRTDGVIEDEDALPSRVRTLLADMEEERRACAVVALSKVLGTTLDVQRVLDVDFHRRLSAGQRIVANIVADLCAHLRRRSLVLLDEPETHLHPQLVTRLLSVVDDLLEGFDSVAVVATHSPIVVQQALARRVHVIRRVDGDLPLVDSPAIETFGENLSDIVRVVFEAPEGERGYQEILDNLLRRHGGDAETVEAMFDGRLGFNAQMYLRSGRRRD